MSDQIDIAVDLGVVPPPLLEILTLRRLVEAATAPPRLLIDEHVEHESEQTRGRT